MPPTFTLPEEVTRAVEEPLPKLRSVALEEKVGNEADSFLVSSSGFCFRRVVSVDFLNARFFFVVFFFFFMV